MCTTVVHPEKGWLTSINDLATIGVTVLPADKTYPDDPNDLCLCGVHVQAALARHGWVWRDDTAGAFLDLIEQVSGPGGERL